MNGDSFLQGQCKEFTQSPLMERDTYFVHPIPGFAAGLGVQYRHGVGAFQAELWCSGSTAAAALKGMAALWHPTITTTPSGQVNQSGAAQNFVGSPNMDLWSEEIYLSGTFHRETTVIVPSDPPGGTPTTELISWDLSYSIDKRTGAFTSITADWSGIASQSVPGGHATCICGVDGIVTKSGNLADWDMQWSLAATMNNSDGGWFTHGMADELTDVTWEASVNATQAMVRMTGTNVDVQVSDYCVSALGSPWTVDDALTIARDELMALLIIDQEYDTEELGEMFLSLPREVRDGTWADSLYACYSWGYPKKIEYHIGLHFAQFYEDANTHAVLYYIHTWKPSDTEYGTAAYALCQQAWVRNTVPGGRVCFSVDQWSLPVANSNTNPPPYNWALPAKTGQSFGDRSHDGQVTIHIGPSSLLYDYAQGVIYCENIPNDPDTSKWPAVCNITPPP